MRDSKAVDRRKTLIRWVEQHDESLPLQATFKELEQIRRLWLEEFSERLQVPLDAFLRSQPSETYEQKTRICRFINASLASVDLTVCCPKTGFAAMLVGNHGDNPNSGRIQLNVNAPDFGRRVTQSRVHFSDLLPLKLMPRPTRSSEEICRDEVNGPRTRNR